MKAFEIAGVPRDEVYRFVRGLHSDPFSVLGPHKVGDDVEIRVFRPDARAGEVVLDREPDKAIAAERIDEEGFFCATVTGAERDVPYHLRIVKLDGSEERTRDAYYYGLIMGEVDLHLFGEGQHWRIYEKFGAHVRTIGDATWRLFRGLGSERATRERGWRLQRLGRTGSPNAQVVKQQGMGIVYYRASGEMRTTNLKSAPPTGAILLKSDPFAFFNQHGK